MQKSAQPATQMLSVNCLYQGMRFSATKSLAALQVYQFESSSPTIRLLCTFVLRTRVVRGLEDVWLCFRGADVEDVPGVGGNDVGGDEVDLVGV